MWITLMLDDVQVLAPLFSSANSMGMFKKTRTANYKILRVKIDITQPGAAERSGETVWLCSVYLQGWVRYLTYCPNVKKGGCDDPEMDSITITFTDQSPVEIPFAGIETVEGKSKEGY